MNQASLNVQIHNRSGRNDVDVAHWRQVAVETLKAEGVRRGDFDLIFVPADEMSELNHVHMGHDGPTDVLSFPLDRPSDGLDPQSAAELEVPRHLGDVVICPQVAEQQAPEHCGDFESELALLVIHGVLHVLGHEHRERQEQERMLERERIHLSRHGYRHPGAMAP